MELPFIVIISNKEVDVMNNYEWCMILENFKDKR